MQVPLLDLKAQYATIKDEILSAISEVLESQRCIGGPKVAQLEEKIAAVSDCRFAVGASSGTDAIMNSLMSLAVLQGLVPRLYLPTSTPRLTTSTLWV